MTDQQEFPAEWVEAARSAWLTVEAETSVDEWCQNHADTERRAMRAILHTLRGLGVLAAPGEVVVPKALLDAARDMQQVKSLTSVPRKIEFSAARGGIMSVAKVEDWMREVHARFDAALAAAPSAGTEGGQ